MCLFRTKSFKTECDLDTNERKIIYFVREKNYHSSTAAYNNNNNKTVGHKRVLRMNYIIQGNINKMLCSIDWLCLYFLFFYWFENVREIRCETYKTIGELKNLAKSAVKSFRNDEDLEDSLIETDLTFTKNNLTIKCK
ncbi:hypothetical protein QTP88_000288 [Uroleucon formosanum]